MPVELRGEWRGEPLAEPQQVIPPELERAMREALALLEREVKIRTPIGVTESARGSIGSEIQRGVAAGRGQIVGVVGSPLAHVGVLERGRRPGQRMPPPDALELWVRRRLGVRDVEEAQQVAWLVARAIGRKGIKAVRMFEKALKEKQATVFRIFDRAGVTMALKLVRQRRGRGS